MDKQPILVCCPVCEEEYLIYKDHLCKTLSFIDWLIRVFIFGRKR